MKTDTNDETPMRGDLPLDWHPGSIDPLGETLRKSGLGGLVHGSARTALTSMYTAFGIMKDAVREATPAEPVRDKTGRPVPGTYIDRERLRLPYKNELKLVNGLDAAFGRVVPVVANHVKAMQTQVEKMEADLNASLNDPVLNMPLAGEIRAHVKGMPKTKRQTFLADAARRGDKQTVAAVFGAPAYLSGLEDDEHASLRAQILEALVPEKQAAVVAARRVLRHVQKAADSFGDSFNKLRPTPIATLARTDAALRKLGGR